MKYQIEKGDRFLCIKSYVIDDDKIVFKRKKHILQI